MSMCVLSKLFAIETGKHLSPLAKNRGRFAGIESITNPAWLPGCSSLHLPLATCLPSYPALTKPLIGLIINSVWHTIQSKALLRISLQPFRFEFEFTIGFGFEWPAHTPFPLCKCKSIRIECEFHLKIIRTNHLVGAAALSAV